MAIEYKHLSEEDFPQAHETMLEAFSDYHLDMSYMTAERSWLRNLKSGVRYDCSVGAYDGRKMVGLTFVGLDDHQGEKSAFDAATGIIPEYRGQAVAKGMFEFILPGLRERGVTKFLLEVLKPNEAAIRAYTKTGFKSTREFACYDMMRESFVAKEPADKPFEVRVIDKAQVREFSDQTDWEPSWENSFAGMNRIQDELIRLGAFGGGECLGILVYYPLLQWIMCLLVKKGFRRKGVASVLLKALWDRLPEGEDRVKINNIDRSDKATLALLEQAGAHHVIDQYEMEFRLFER